MFRNTSDKEIEYRHLLRQPTAPLGSVICRESCHRTRFGVPRASHDRSRRFPLVAPTPLFSCKRSKFIHERTRPQARILSRPSEEEGNVRRSRKQGWATIGDKDRAGEIFRPQRHRLAEVFRDLGLIRFLNMRIPQLVERPVASRASGEHPPRAGYPNQTAALERNRSAWFQLHIDHLIAEPVSRMHSTSGIGEEHEPIYFLPIAYRLVTVHHVTKYAGRSASRRPPRFQCPVAAFQIVPGDQHIPLRELPSPSHIRNLQWPVRQNTACESIHHRSREISSREISLAKLHLSRCRVNASQSPGKTRDALSLSASGIVSGTSGCRAKERLISSAGGGAIQSMPYSNRIRPIECSVPHDPAPRFRGDLLEPTAKRAQPHPSAH